MTNVPVRIRAAEPRAAQGRGQNLLLLSLTMLIVTLMVLITLGIAQHIRENHELNNLADVSAYSSAVVNARAYNNIAILNRLQVSYWVSMAANESLISWTSYNRALWSGTTGVLYSSALNQSGPNADCQKMDQDISQLVTLIGLDFASFQSGWRAADNRAGEETRDIQGVIADIRQETRGIPALPQPDGVRDRLFNERQQQNLARQIVTRTGIPGISVVPTSGSTGAAAISGREVGNFNLNVLSECAGDETGLCGGQHWSDNVVAAAMGTRGSHFVTGRGVLPPAILSEWARISVPSPPVANPGNWHGTRINVAGGVPTGSGYFADTLTHATSPTGTFAWADDHGQLTGSTRFAGCAGTATPVDVMSHVKTTDLLDTSDEHVWTPRDPALESSDTQADVYHTTGDCTPLCPSVWVREVNFLPETLADPDAAKDAYGMPKVAVMLVRDATVHTDPWQMHFKLNWNSSTTASFDNRGRALQPSSLGSGLDISNAGALATGMTYYHRKDNWLEYPNLLNPFWRATLVAADIDKGGKAGAYDDDVDQVLSTRPSEAWQTAAYDALIANGFKGLH